MDFIEIYDRSLSKEECSKIISIFESNSDHHNLGAVGGGQYNPKIKRSVNLDLTTNPNSNRPFDRSISNIIAPPLKKCTEKYKKKYQYLKNIFYWSIQEDYNMQRFDRGDGYFSIHCEADGYACHRVLAWMIYLNNAKSGTKFYNQNRVIRARTGRLVIWPAGWTHVHSGVIPNLDSKYLITGWYTFNFR